MDNIFAAYKEKGPTSNDIVQLIKKKSGGKKVGHAGTLDPLAKGVLVIGVGREATKKLGEIANKGKEYIALIKLGEFTETDDQQGEKTKIDVKAKLDIKDIKQAVKRWQGKVWQTPPKFSAIKVRGKEAYKLARKGQVVKLKPREVEIKKIKILAYNWPYLELKVLTGPGVYIRSLARDIGKELTVGAYLHDLERIRVGQFRKNNALSLKQLKNTTL